MAQELFWRFTIELGCISLAPSGNAGLHGFRASLRVLSIGLRGFRAGLRGFRAGLRGSRAGSRGFGAGLCGSRACLHDPRAGLCGFCAGLRGFRSRFCISSAVDGGSAAKLRSLITQVWSPALQA